VSYFLDTNTCIYFLKGMYPAIEAMLSAQRPKDVKIASVVMAELLFGVANSQCVKENAERVESFLFPFEIVPFDSIAAYAYAKIRHGLTRNGALIGGNDLMIASTALANAGILVTNNVAEFGRVEGLSVENWVE